MKKTEEKAREGELYDGTLLWRELLNQMQNYADEVEKGHLDGKEFAKFVRESVKRIFSNELNNQHKQDEQV